MLHTVYISAIIAVFVITMAFDIGPINQGAAYKEGKAVGYTLGYEDADRESFIQFMKLSSQADEAVLLAKKSQAGWRSCLDKE